MYRLYEVELSECNLVALSCIFWIAFTANDWSAVFAVEAKLSKTSMSNYFVIGISAYSNAY